MKQISIIGKRVAVRTDDNTVFEFEFKTAVPGEIPEGFFHAATLRERGRIDVWYLLPIIIEEKTCDSLSARPLIPPPDTYKFLNLSTQTGEPWFKDLLDAVIGVD